MYRFILRRLPRPALVPLVFAVVLGIAFPVATIHLMVVSATAASRSQTAPAAPAPCPPSTHTQLARR